ncbi:hypothetical protein JNUCC31_15760 [Paenibacillus sp. JNUCC31]|uniref:hypothetical protein n=1 Tax=Paenibacillus sp. JNUCC-31 TaxID=2777983 RepID=UPI0017850E90|nr:hypothetical protein [Paenibacillus sp. JNUCC-31]QOS82151.1 hypothetical protein JNUCC31_15760 [Paenibacillus sp. JNUCC-31]
MKIMADKQYVFQEGQPFQSSHASIVAMLPIGEVEAARFAGTHEKASDVAIGMLRKQGGACAVPPRLAVYTWKRNRIAFGKLTVNDR